MKLGPKRFVPPPKPSVWPDYNKMIEAITNEQRFLAAAHAGHNVFLTGMAGTGKSTLLRQFIAETESGIRDGVLTLGADKKRIDVTAPTGIAALNVGGLTIHRFCGMLLGPAQGQTNEEYAAILDTDFRPSVLAGKRRVKTCRCLVIDEISMLPGRQLDFVDFWFRHLRHCNEPFGGCQVIVIGDFLQLPPVRTSEEQPYDWAFTCRAWKEAGFKTIQLETVRRQDEPEFIQALSQFRRGHIRGDAARLLQGRVVNFPNANLTRLFTHNVQVDKWNDYRLGELAGEEVVLHAKTSGDPLQLEFLTKHLLTPRVVRLKPGALVMFTVNDKDRFVNGQIGCVAEIMAGGSLIAVNVRRGQNSIETILVEPRTWQYDPRDDQSAKFTQFPLRLAYAMTIHKSQGTTLSGAYIDIRAAREPGQAYVAVSRVKTLAGLHLKEWPKGVFVSDDALKFYCA